METAITAKVIKVIDSKTIVINKGSNDGVQSRQKYLVYYNGEELFDPDTNETLGVLEIICGQAEPKHIQPRITTLESSQRITTQSKTVIKTGGSSIFGETKEVYDPQTEIAPLNGVHVDCLVKQIR